MATLLRLLTVLSFSLTLAPGGLPPEEEVWFPIQLEGGAVYDLDVMPFSEGGQRTIAVGGWAFGSNRGQSWRRLGDSGPATHVVTAPDGGICVDGPEGVANCSVNLGRTWRRARLRGNDPVRVLALSPSFSVDRQGFAITLGDWRLYQTDEAGGSWREIVVERGESVQVGAVAFSPLHQYDETIFAATDRGLYKSTNSGQSWEPVAGEGMPAFAEPGGPADDQGLIVSPEYGIDRTRTDELDDRTLFAFNAAGVYRSDDDGARWRRLPLDVTHVHDLVVSPGWPRDRMLLSAVEAPGHIGAYSTDGGDTWRMVGGRDGVVGQGAALATDFASRLDPETGERTEPGSREMLIGTDGDAVWRSRDGGTRWFQVQARLNSVETTAVELLPGGANADALIGTAQSGLYRSRDGGRTWRRLDAGLPRGEGQQIHAILRSPAFATDNTVFLAAESGVWVSRDRGWQWSRSDGPVPATTLAISPAFASDRTLVASGQLSADGGSTWRPLSPLPEGGPWSAVTFSPEFATDTTLWAGNAEKLYVSRDSGAAWEPIDHPAMANREIWAIDVLKVEGTVDPLRVFAGTSRGLVVSQDAGEGWRGTSTISGGIRDVRSLSVRDPFVTAIVQVVGEGGVAWSVNRGGDWTTSRSVPRPMRAAALASDGTVMLALTPGGVARYGIGSMRTFLPDVANAAVR